MLVNLGRRSLHVGLPVELGFADSEITIESALNPILSLILRALVAVDVRVTFQMCFFQQAVTSTGNTLIQRPMASDVESAQH